jgi:DNA-binding Xre family transcriptional regulator
MEYNDLKEIFISKNDELKDIASELEMTPNGFRESIKNETIQLRKLKQLCTRLKLNPLLFFDVVPGTYINNVGNGHTQVGNGNKIQIENKDREIEMLKQRLADKDEIIKLLRERNNNSGYGLTAAEPR